MANKQDQRKKDRAPEKKVNKETPRPGTKKYNVEKTEELTMPKYHSSTDYRNSPELPAIENLNDLPGTSPDEETKNKDIPKTDLGNKRADDEKQREKIITP